MLWIQVDEQHGKGDRVGERLEFAHRVVRVLPRRLPSDTHSLLVCSGSRQRRTKPYELLDPIVQPGTTGRPSRMD